MEQERMLSDNALTEDEAARFLGVYASFLAERRCYGEDPALVKYGAKRTVCLRPDLETWCSAQQRLPQAATALQSGEAT